jgi:hypothetical protein
VTAVTAAVRPRDYSPTIDNGHRHIGSADTTETTMTKTLAIAAAAIAITAVLTGSGMASPCHYDTYQNTYVAPTYTDVTPTYTNNYYNGY